MSDFEVTTATAEQLAVFRAATKTAPIAAVRHVFWPAGAAIPESTSVPYPAVTDSGSVHAKMDTLGFDSTTQESCQFVAYLEHWGAGTIKCRAVWTYAGSPTGTKVEWGFSARALANDDAQNQAFGTAQVIYDTKITAGDEHVTDASPAITVGGTPANGRRIQLKVTRNPASSNDDLGTDALLLGIWVEYTEAAIEEAAW